MVETATKKGKALQRAFPFQNAAMLRPATVCDIQACVLFAFTLAKNPKLLLCDEPTGALDYVTGKNILKLLQDTCRRTGMTVVIITHNSALTAMADRVISIKSGTIQSVRKNEHVTPVEEIEW